MSSPIYVGVDLGGTTIKIGLCDENGKLLHSLEEPTEAEKGAEGVLENIVAYVSKLVQESPFGWEQVAGIGAGIPGFMDIPEGFVKLSPNLGWRDVPVKKILESKFGKPVKIDNDANVAALGEAWSGAGAGIPNVVCLTLGTGVGGGIIMKRSLYQGFSGMAGELGHLNVVPTEEATLCGCGKRGCLETVSSATGIIRMANEAIRSGQLTMLSSVGAITAKNVFEAVMAGDEIANCIYERAALYLGKAMALVTLIVNPQRFVIGGGVSKAGDLLFDSIRKYFHEFALENAYAGVDVVPAVLGNDAGVVGAAGLVLYS